MDQVTSDVPAMIEVLKLLRKATAQAVISGDAVVRGMSAVDDAAAAAMVLAGEEDNAITLLMTLIDLNNELLGRYARAAQILLDRRRALTGEAPAAGQVDPSARLN